VRTRYPRIAVIGGGTGGLCLAQALRKAGVDVTVYERSRTRTELLQGYLLHITPWGARILRDCLPPEVWRAFEDTCGVACGDFGFVNERLDDLVRISTEQQAPVRSGPTNSFRSVSRITLHQLLSAGLADSVRYDKEFTHYTRAEDGSVTCHFADGTSVTADVVVAADGANSRVRAQYLPQARRVDTGIRVIAGKLPLTEVTRRGLPTRLLNAPNNVLAPGSRGMFVAPHDLGERVTTDSQHGIGGNDESVAINSALFDNTRSYLMWVYATGETGLPSSTRLSILDGTALRSLVGDAISDWHPTLREMVGDTPADAVSALTISTSVPLPRWPASNITLLGDAIHSMSPFRGIGANIALRDASVLARNLVSAAGGELTPLEAIDDYERQMTSYGFAAVRESLRAAREFVSPTRSPRTLDRTVRRFFPDVPAAQRVAVHAAPAE
jgi:salicylate hydroxylase